MEAPKGTSGENKGKKKSTKKKAAKNYCGFKLRFYPKRLGNVGNSLSPKKHDIVRAGPFGDLLDIKPFIVPHELIEFVVMHTNHTLRQFKYKDNAINFNKLMVKRIFNVPSGDKPIKLLNKCDHCDLRNIYKDGNKAPIANAIKLLEDCSETDEVMVNRTWALIALATVLCPGTDNMINLEYLGSLEDMSLVRDFSWDEHLLAAAMEEVATFQEKKRIQGVLENPTEFKIGSCLPMLAIIYMDHLHIPPGLQNKHVIDYSTPRIRVVCQKDFKWVVKLDKNKLTLTQPFYGKHTAFQSLANTPYSAELKGPGVGVEAASGQGVGDEANYGQENQAQAPKNEGNVSQQNEDAGANLSASLNDWLQQPFPSIQDLRVPDQFQMLYDKHKGIFASEVDHMVGKFGQGLKELQCNRMAALLRDVGDAISSSKEPNISFEAMSEGHEEAMDAPAAAATAEVITKKVFASEDLEKNNDVAIDVSGTREQLSMSFEKKGNILPQSPPLFFDAPRSAAAGIWDDEPSFELFETGSEEYVWLHSMEEPTNKNSKISTLKLSTTVFPVSDNERPMDNPGISIPTTDEQTPQVIHVSYNEMPMGSPIVSTPTTVATDEKIVDVSSVPSTHDKNTRKKRMANALANKPKSKKKKKKKEPTDEVEAMYEKYIMHGKPLKRTKKDEQPKPFVNIGGFYIGYKKFRACLKPRGDMNDEVMSLYIEIFNMSHLKEANNTVTKFMLSVLMADRLKLDPSRFQPSVVMAEFKRALKKEIQKYDLLFFTIVDEHHWIVVCANLLHKQWNIFDSVVAKGKQSILKRVANNLITNFIALTQECDGMKINFASFPRVDIREYPKQTNLCECGFFGILYALNFDGKVMKEFSTNDIPLFRKKVAHCLMTHPLNNAPMEAAFKDELTVNTLIRRVKA